MFNGLLLAVQWDAAFDQGFVSFTDDGVVLVSRHLPPDEASRLGLDLGLRLEGLRAGHKPYLAWHRERVFEASEPE